MSFGIELKEQVPAILDYVGQGITSLSQFRLFIKEKSHLDREYAQKLENLTKKHKPSKKDHGEDMTEGTTYAVWTQFLEQTSFIAKNRLGVADQLHQVAETLREINNRKEEGRKKHTTFYQKLKQERDKTYSEKDRAKQVYDEACVEIENLKSKLNKTSDPDKVQKQLETAYMECDNKKNMYLLSLSVANAERTKYFDQDLPLLADQLQALDAERIECLQSTLKQSISVEHNSAAIVKQCHDDTEHFIDSMNPLVEAERFAQRTVDLEATERNLAFQFMPWNGGANASETIIDRDARLVVNDAAVIFLNNKLLKDRKRLTLLTQEIAQKASEASGLEAEIASNKTTAEYDKSKEKWLDTLREWTLLSTDQAKVKSEVDLIVDQIGDDGLRAMNHDFKSSSFTIPTTCDYCANTIWGLSNKGLTCKACGFNCHAKCEMKVAPNCSKVKGQVNPQPVSSLSRSQSKSTFNDSGSLSQASVAPSEASFSSMVPQAPSSPMVMPEPAVSRAPIEDTCCLYSYEAQSPDELSIREGEMLTMVEPDDGSGWVKVGRGPTTGLVPASYIQPLHVVTAIYDYTTDNPEELELHEGDHIQVIKQDDSGWWEGKLNGKVGVFPANYL
ncbi:hypothetical protein BY458DRAFT_34648 [Sporodiniella umbellata]|nr:hypothetical protein BY458DRAFT_34648 [Sporodiniella umbellata]